MLPSPVQAFRTDLRARSLGPRCRGARLGAGCFLLFGPNPGFLFVATAFGYFLTYEWLHFAYHLPDGHPLRALPGLARLRRHHQVHHDPHVMSHAHFNITFPLCDWAFGTRTRKRTGETRA